MKSLLFTLLAALPQTCRATALPARGPVSLVQARQDPGTTILYPYATYRWWLYDGAVKEDPQDQLLVVKDHNPRNESTTLVTFNIASDLQGRGCRLVFDLWDRDVSTGTQTADVFTSVRPGNRDQHVGRLYLPKPGAAEWVFAYRGLPDFDCPAGELIGFEFVGVGDEVGIRWDIGVTGPRVLVV
ncbi:hypothetical protein BJX61DRAFT_539609 [Aspergillus egyptiacus]|nr:hypothetical protein BJX61DRAFT_539609 [Aspergillus egyptiacus]